MFWGYFLTEVLLIYNVVLMPAIQQNGSVIHIYIYIYIFILKYSFPLQFISGHTVWFPLQYSRSLSPVSPALQVGSLPAWPSGKAPYMRADIY